MLDGVIRWALGNRAVVLACALGVLGWGAWEASRMPVDVFPDLTAPTVTVLAEAHGMAPREVESQVTFPIEAALNGASGVRRVRSSTSVGIAVVWVEFEWGVDIFRARQVVSEKLQLVRDALPPELPPPVLAPVSSIMGEILFIALTSDTHTPMELRTAADWTLRRRLLAVPGVSQVVPIGGEQRQLQVVLRPDRLAAHGLTGEDVVTSLRATNENTSAGFVTDGGQEHLVEAVGRVHRAEDLEETLVAMRGEPVLVRDVAHVGEGAAPRRGTGAFNGRPAVIVGIQKQPDANTLLLTARIDQALDDVARTLPPGMKIERHIFRQAEFIEVAVDNVATALRDGAILVVVIVLAFLASGRATAITALAIPLSLVVAVLVMRALGESINTMTLGGMAIAVGALVDDAIIDVENVVRRLHENLALPPPERRSSLSVVLHASREIRSSIAFATLIIVLVFLPLFFLSGVEGRLLRPLGLAYVISLGASLVIALTVTPALASLWLPRSHAVSRAREPWLIRALKRAYAPSLRLALRWWRTLALVSAALLAGSVWALGHAGRSFLPDFDEGTLTISVVTLPGTSLDESDALGRMVDELLLEQPEVVAVARRTGRAELDEHAQGVNAAEIDVRLRLLDRPKEALLQELRERLTLVPGASVVIGQPISHRIDHMLSGTRAAVAVKIFGPDLYELRRLAAEMRAVMADVRGVVDLAVEEQSDIPLVTARLRRPEIARHGLRVQDVAHALETAFGGRVVGKVLEDQAAFDLVVRAGGSPSEVDTVGDTLIPTPAGAQVPLRALANVDRDLGPSAISREGGQRKIVVMCNVAGRDLRGVVDDIRARVTDRVALDSGYHVEYGGQFESAAEASRTLLVVGAGVVAGVFLLLFAALGSGRDAALVMVNLPLALIGGVAGVFVSGGVLSVASIIGFITLFGIATRNGIMMLAHIRHLVQEEQVTDPFEAVRRGAMERLAPILMTALASGLGLLPLALAGGEPGSEIQTPMALVILCGLVSSTFLNMVVVPALALRFGSVRLETSGAASGARTG
ncbi:MAG: multidrug transporter AcrB [Myxococcales bacterium]